MTTDLQPASPTVAPVEAWACLYRGTFRCQSLTVGKAPKKCSACGGPIYTARVFVTVQEWRGDGRYTLASATKVYRSVAAAERYAVATNDTLVVRLVHAEG